ncbi:hypothetical protein [Candidatus Uabimicrobium sp. HlEnr_7]|uniref:hypothetical protein n=1 Tax=Candidatus Uabimicrobium helgolandensis TaxID=3095367 RepID=UPI003558C788
MKNDFVAQLKKNVHPSAPLGESLIIGAIGGAAFYLSLAIFAGPIHIDILLMCTLFGLLGGALPELIFLVAGNSIALVRSWTMVAILLVLLPAVPTGFYGTAFIYGYLIYLLSLARKKGLPDT